MNHFVSSFVRFFTLSVFPRAFVGQFLRENKKARVFSLHGTLCSFFRFPVFVADDDDDVAKTRQKPHHHSLFPAPCSATRCFRNACPKLNESASCRSVLPSQLFRSSPYLGHSPPCTLRSGFLFLFFITHVTAFVFFSHSSYATHTG